MRKHMSHIKEMADFLDDDTIDWQNGLAHLADANFDSIYNQQHHLLGRSHQQKQANSFRHPQGNPQNEPQQQEDSDETKVSDALTYGPRFCQIFREYTQALGKPVNVDRHLMSLCTEHLVPFCNWARENEAKTTSIRTTLLEYDYLRPEVRNGIVMVIIYTFASIKSTRESGTDMFITLQDTERGLGIANKFSLKIYNDPFMYLSFLKISISALIDAGAIPDNERVNQPKRNKVMVENKEELDAYDQIQRRLVSLLDSGDNAGAKHIVLLMTNYWQQRAKFIRNRRFVSVLHALGSPNPVSGMITQSSSSNNNHQAPQGQGQGSYAGSGAGAGALISTQSQGQGMPTGEINRNPQCHAVGTTSQCCGACSGTHGTSQSAAASSAADEDKAQITKRMRPSPAEATAAEIPVMENAKPSHPETAPGLSTSHYHFPTGRRCSPRPIDALRFERVGTHEWGIVETKVYDVCEFMKMLALDMGDTPVCLIDESVLQKSPGFMPKKLNSKIGLGGIGYKSCSDGVMSLTKELTLNNALITSWTKADRPQLREMACQWQWQKQLPATDSEGDSNSKDETMITFWRSSDTTDFSLGGRNSCLCDTDVAHPCGGGGGGCDCSGEGGHEHYNRAQDPIKPQRLESSASNNSVSSLTERPSLSYSSSSSSSDQLAVAQSHSSSLALRPMQPTMQYSSTQSQHASQLHAQNTLHAHTYTQHTQSQPKGYLVYEQTLQVGVVVRANPSIGLREDLWCVLFPTELNPITSSESFGALLSRLFPQLTALYGRKDSEDIHGMRGFSSASDSSKRAESMTAVKYYAHQKGHSLNHPPAAPDNPQSYRTVGTVSLPASILLARSTQTSDTSEHVNLPIRY